MTTRSLPLLDRVHVASPCGARWDDMVGDEKRRFCSRCNLHVHNLTAMTAGEAEALLQSAGEGLCARFYKRADGTVLTQDCPVGIAAVRARMRRVVGRVAAALGLVSISAALAGSRDTAPVRMRSLRPLAVLAEWLAPAAPVIPSGSMLLDGRVSFWPAPGSGTTTSAAPGAQRATASDQSGTSGPQGLQP